MEDKTHPNINTVEMLEAARKYSLQATYAIRHMRFYFHRAYADNLIEQLLLYEKMDDVAKRLEELWVSLGACYCAIGIILTNARSEAAPDE